MSGTFEPGEAQAVARALAAIAAADRAIVAREESFLDEFATRHGVGTHAWIPVPLDEEGLARAIRNPTRQRETLRLCVRLALCDGDYAPAEVEAVGRIARAFGIEESELAELTREAQGL